MLAASQCHDCRYCPAAHGAIVTANGVDPDVVHAVVWTTPLASPRHEALRRRTLELVERRGHPSDETPAELVAVGYMERQVLEVILANAMTTISNDTNHVIHAPVDQRFARFAPELSGVSPGVE